MKKSLIIYGLVFFISISALWIQGCGKAPSEDGRVEVKVAFWGYPEEIEIVKGIIAEWEEQHPGIRVTLEHSPYTGYDSKILTRIAGGAAPDVIATEVDYFVTFATKGVLVDLTEFARQDPEFSEKDFFPRILDRFTVEGRLLAVPRDVAPFACVVDNKKLFDEAGLPYPKDNWSWKDLLHTARALTKKDENGRIIQYGFWGWAWQNFLYGNGGALVDDVKNPTRTLIAEPKAAEGIQFFSDLSGLYEVMPSPVALSNLGMGVDLMFKSGRLAMFLSGIWETPGLRRYNFDWDVAMFPKNEDGIRAFGAGGTGYALLRTSKCKKEAWEVIKALTGVKAQTEMARRGLTQPARIEVAKGEAFAGNPLPPKNKKMLNKAVQHIVFSPFHPRWREAEDRYLVPKLDLVFNGKKTAQEVLDEVAPKINALLKGA